MVGSACPHAPGLRGRRLASEDEGRSSRDVPLLEDVRSSDSLHNNVNNIRKLEFYHSIRGRLRLSVQLTLPVVGQRRTPGLPGPRGLLALPGGLTMVARCDDAWCAAAPVYGCARPAARRDCRGTPR